MATVGGAGGFSPAALARMRATATASASDDNVVAALTTAGPATTQDTATISPAARLAEAAELKPADGAQFYTMEGNALNTFSEQAWERVGDQNRWREAGIGVEDFLSIRGKAQEYALQGVGGDESHPGLGESQYIGMARALGEWSEQQVGATLADGATPDLSPEGMTRLAAQRELQVASIDYQNSRGVLMARSGTPLNVMIPTPPGQ